MSSQKTYEIAFQMGANMDSSVRKAFSSANKNLDKIGNNAEDASEKTGLLQKSLQSIGKVGLAGVGAAMTAAAGGAAAAFASAENFQQAMRSVEAATGASNQEMNELETISKNLYNNNMGENWQDLADAVSQTKNITGLAGEELQNATNNAIAYRDTFGADLQSSIQATDTMMKNFGITSEQAYNLLAQGQQAGLDKSGDLLESANEYANHFSNLGMNAEEMFSIFQQGADSGAFSVDKVGDAVKEFGIRATDGSKASQEAFETLGLNADKMTQKISEGGPAAQKAFQTVIKELDKAGDSQEALQAGAALMGAPFEDLGVEAIAALSNVQNEFDITKASMDQIGDVKYDTVGQAFQGIGRQLQTGLLIPMGEKLMPVLQRFSDFINANMPAIKSVFGGVIDSIVQSLNNMGDSFSTQDLQNFITSIQEKMPQIKSSIQGAFSTAGVIINTFGKTLNWVRKNSDQLLAATAGLASAFIAFKVITSVVAMFRALRTALAAATIAQRALNLTMMISPIGVIAAAVGALVAAGVLLWKNFDIVKVKVQQLWQKLLNNPIMAIVAGPIGALIAAGISLWKNWDLIRAKSIQIWNAIKSFFAGIGPWFSKLFSGIGNAAASVGKAIGSAFTSAYNGITSLFSGIGNWFSGVFSSVTGAFRSGINGVIGLANSAIGSLNNISVDIPNWVPGMGGKSFGVNIPRIPMLAEGGITTGATLAMIGEGAEQEAVLPLSKLEGMLSSSETDNSSSYTDNDTKFVYAPVHYHYGDTNQEDIENAERESQRDFEKRMRRYEKEKERKDPRR
ncbi:phage tail tape measure protein [Salibacterium halotolerans]|uniref:Phage-related minor tail protein n=1 Tax=Salibacterium halotolerans TaxID=1884432 RepID=A0A1I5MP38_9BACI|nr:phage tail tape measure protein [Salibacterium halotolerans]SFP11319.1 Phage-related minor tail protein [Salibacterium halotolerans]